MTVRNARAALLAVALAALLAGGAPPAARAQDAAPQDGQQAAAESPSWNPVEALGRLFERGTDEVKKGIDSWWRDAGPLMVYRLAARAVGYAARQTVGSEAAVGWSADMLVYAPARTYADATTARFTRLVAGLVGALVGLVVTFTGLGVMWASVSGTATDAMAVLPRCVVVAIGAREAPRFTTWLTDVSNGVTRYLAGTDALPGSDAVGAAAARFADAQAAGAAAADDITTGTLFIVYGIAGLLLKLGRFFQEALWSFLIAVFVLALAAWILRSTFTWFGRWLTLAAAVLIGGPLQAIPLRQGGEKVAEALTSATVGDSLNGLVAGIASITLAFFVPALVGVTLSGPGLRTVRRAAATAARLVPAGAAAGGAAAAAGAVSSTVAGAARVAEVTRGPYEITRMPLLPVPRAALPAPR